MIFLLCNVSYCQAKILQLGGTEQQYVFFKQQNNHPMGRIKFALLVSDAG